MHLFMALVLSISLILPLVAMILSSLPLMRERLTSSFECGFDSWGTGKINFSLRFFIIILVFLIFDLELIFFFPLLLNTWKLTAASLFFPKFLFLFVLMTTLYEWFMGNLDWKS